MHNSSGFFLFSKHKLIIAGNPGQILTSSDINIES